MTTFNQHQVIDRRNLRNGPGNSGPVMDFLGIEEVNGESLVWLRVGPNGREYRMSKVDFTDNYVAYPPQPPAPAAVTTSEYGITTRVTTYYGYGPGVIGATYAVPTATGFVYLTQAHDWDGDSDNRFYDPITVGAFDDPEQAANEIERRARVAQAPDTVIPGEDPR
jgi:hypothetical protein